MAINIDDPEVDRLAQTLADLTGESVTEVIRVSLQERLSRAHRQRRPREQLVRELREISRRSAALPRLDTRPEDEILGYDKDGLPA